MRPVRAGAAADGVELSSRSRPVTAPTASEPLPHLDRLLDVPERAVEGPGDLVAAEHVQRDLLCAELASSCLEREHRLPSQTPTANCLVELDLVQPRTRRAHGEEEPPDRAPVVVLDHEEMLALGRSPFGKHGSVIALGLLLGFPLRHPRVPHQVADVEPPPGFEPVGKLVLAERSQGNGHRERGC